VKITVDFSLMPKIAVSNPAVALRLDITPLLKALWVDESEDASGEPG
jgi:hypothetical protein